MKTCPSCGRQLTDDCFCSKTIMCRECRRRYDSVRKHRTGNSSGRNHTQAARLRKRRWAKANRDFEKESARRAVRIAIESGRLVPARQCDVCGSSATRIDGRRGIQAHHYAGYENKLTVSWLCPKCHRKADAARKQEGSK